MKRLLQPNAFLSYINLVYGEGTVVQCKVTKYMRRSTYFWGEGGVMGVPKPMFDKFSQ